VTIERVGVVTGADSKIHDEPHVEGRRISVREIHARVEGRGLRPETVADRHGPDVADSTRRSLAVVALGSPCDVPRWFGRLAHEDGDHVTEGLRIAETAERNGVAGVGTPLIERVVAPVFDRRVDLFSEPRVSWGPARTAVTRTSGAQSRASVSTSPGTARRTRLDRR
jgi:hypothetical protein